MQKMNSIITD